MGRYVVKRLLQLIPILLAVTVVVFTLMYLCPGDPADILLAQDYNPKRAAELRHEMGLDRSYIVQLLDYMQRIFLHMDFGKSIKTGQNLTTELFSRFPITLRVAVGSVLLAFAVGVPLGITAAVHQNTARDSGTMIIALLGSSIPSFWFAMLLSLLFSLTLKWLPSSGISSWKSYILPIAANSISGVATMARQMRSSMLEVIRADYVVTAKAKGVPQKSVIYKHALKNALIPVITLSGSTFGTLLGGAIVVETVFALPGVGTYILNGINNRDYNVVQGSVVLLSLIFGIVMLLVDLLYAAIDPRIKSQFASSKRIRRRKPV